MEDTLIVTFELNSCPAGSISLLEAFDTLSYAESVAQERIRLGLADHAVIESASGEIVGVLPSLSRKLNRFPRQSQEAPNR